MTQRWFLEWSRPITLQNSLTTLIRCLAEINSNPSLLQDGEASLLWNNFSVQSGQNALKSILVKVCFGKIKVHSEANFPLFGVLKPQTSDENVLYNASKN